MVYISPPNLILIMYQNSFSLKSLNLEMVILKILKILIVYNFVEMYHILVN